MPVLTPVDHIIDERLAPWISAFEQAESDFARSGPPWVRTIRREAIERFAELGFPTTKNEDWKFTSVAPLAKIAFRRPSNDNSSVVELPPGLPADAHRLVFVNGRYSRLLSGEPAENGFIVKNLKNAWSAESPAGPDMFHCDGCGDHAFTALNTAFAEDGAFVYIPDGVVVERPIHVIHIAVPGTAPEMFHPRNLFVFAPRSQASLIESYIGTNRNGSGAPYFTNAVTKILGREESIVSHYKLQRETANAFHIATVRAEQGRGSTFSSLSFSFGGALTRNELSAKLAEGSDCALNGVYVAGGRQHVDTHTEIDHAEPRAASRELFKGILNGRSSAVFNGRIIVRKDAQKTDARQTNRNLVLSEDATINTKPELRIYADDVRCTHGATIGQLDEEAIFYLRSRGIARQAAREMLTGAFARELVSTITPEAVRNYFDAILTSRLAEEIA
jgi:Fe-S cluster assembly protein SufD